MVNKLLRREINKLLKKITSNKDNNGSVTITVLVAFLFISVLIAMLLSTVSVNYKMRSIDRRTKDEFYYAEKALNDVYTGIGLESSEIMGASYSDVLAHYRGASSGGGYTYKDEQRAYSDFAAAFIKSFHDQIAVNYNTKLNSYIVQDSQSKSTGNKTSRAEVKNPGTIKYYKSVNRNAADLVAYVDDPDVRKTIRCIVIEGIKIASNSDARGNIGYVSEINTDIVIEVPTVSFFSVNSKAFNYAVIANKGIEFADNTTSNIKGSLYGGTVPFADSSYSSMTQSYEYGGIYIKKGATVNINDAEYVVSGGDISVNGGTLNINQTNSLMNNQIWFENLEINSDAKVNINGDLYAADDLQVNTGADGSRVVIKGSYYGYNDGLRQASANGEGTTWVLTTKKAQISSNSLFRRNRDDDNKNTPLTALSGERDIDVNTAARSSSIIMNSKNSTIDMTELRTLMLLGNAYLDPEIKTGFSAVNSKIRDASLPESAALKASQGITLMPSEFLSVSNPAPITNVNENPFTGSTEDTLALISKMSGTGGATWFGKAYINESNPCTVIRVSNNGRHYAYCYLNFKDEDSKKSYVAKIIEGANTGVKPTAKDLKDRLLAASSAYGSELKIGQYSASGGSITMSGNTRIYGKDPILGYDKNLNMNVLATNTSENGAFSAYSANLYNRYRLLDTYLEPLSDVAMSETGVGSIDYQDFKKEDNELPLGRFFWIWGLRKHGAFPTNSADLQAEAATYGSNFIFLRDTSEEGVNLSDKLNGVRNAFVIVDGNAYVNSNITINGFIACSGKLTVKSGGSLNVTYDKALLTKRIERELKAVASNGGYHDEYAPDSGNAAPVNKLLIYYMLNSGRKFITNDGSVYKMPQPASNITNTMMKNNQEPTCSDVSYREYKYDLGDAETNVGKVNTDYQEFMFFDNWKKGKR